jgi:hypothetical protein
LVEISDDAGVNAAPHEIPGVGSLDLIANTDTAGAQDTAIVVDDENRCDKRGLFTTDKGPCTQPHVDMEAEGGLRDIFAGEMLAFRLMNSRAQTLDR